MPKKVICPNVKFDAIKSILKNLLIHGKISVKNLARISNKNISWINNALPLMSEMGLVYRGLKGYVGITNKGEELMELLTTGDDEKIKEFGEEIYKKSDILRVAKKIISDKPNVKLADLGNQITDGLEIPENDKWINETTYVVVARSCLSVLNGLKVVDYQPMKYTRHNIDRFKNKLMPYASTIILDKLLKEVKAQNNEVYTLDSNLFNQYQRQRKTDYFNSAIMLGLIERVPGEEYRYKLTSDGKKLLKASDFSEHAKIFQDILLKNPHIVEIIKTIQNNYDEINSEEIGSIVGEYNKSKWGKGTRTSYGNNFLNWLLEADIMVNRGRKHKYTFQPHFFESDNYKKFFENKSILSGTIEKEIETPTKLHDFEKNQTYKLVHKNPSLEVLNNEELLYRVNGLINCILYEKIENWDRRIIDHQDIIDTFLELEERKPKERLLISSSSTDFTKGYRGKDSDLLKNALNNIIYLLEKERFKG